MTATAKVITATRLTTDVITFAAIACTIIVLAVGMIVAPFAIATWYIQDVSQTSDNLSDQVRGRADSPDRPADHELRLRGLGMLPRELTEVVEEVAPL